MINKLKKVFFNKEYNKAGEELTEKKTTKLGYFLLVLMFFAIISTSQWTINIIQKIPTAPKYPSNCIYNILTTFDKKYNYSYHDYCNGLISNSPKYNFKKEYDILKPDYEKLKNIYTYINEKRHQIDNNKIKIKQYKKDYNLSLTENISNEKDKIFDKQNIKYLVKSLEEKNRYLETDIKKYKKQASILINKNQNIIKQLEEKWKNAIKKYNKSYILYKIYKSLLELIFTIIIFLIVYKIYSKLKSKNSPYTIIFSVTTVAYGFILLQVILLFLWDLIPHYIIKYIISFLSNFKPIIYLLQFLWPILIIGIFGFIVYKIQKRIYSKENIIKRFIDDKKCPECGNTVDITKPYCPLCSNKIQIKCPNCGEYTVKGMTYCSNCGKKIK